MSRKTLVVFAPTRPAPGRAAVDLAVFLEVMDWALWPTVVGTLPPAFLFGVGVALIYGGRSEWNAIDDVRTAAPAVAGTLAVFAVMTAAAVVESSAAGGSGIVGWTVLLGPAAVIGGLAEVAHRGPKVRAAGLAVLAGFAVAGSLGTVLMVGAEIDSVLNYTAIWATLNAVVITVMFAVRGRLSGSPEPTG